jgi:predicted HicB family RNase H-like nuclease
MNNIIEYRGYYTKIEYSSEDSVLRGKIEGIGDLVTFQSTDATKIEEEFHSAVDDYIDFCKEVGKEPDKTYKGTFNIRINPDLHKKLALKAFKNNESLNQTVENAIREYLTPSSEIYKELCAALASQYSSYYEKAYRTSVHLWNMYNAENTMNNRFISNYTLYNKCFSRFDNVEMEVRNV